MLTGHQRIALLRAGITVDQWSDERLRFESVDAGLSVDVREDGLWDAFSGFGSPAHVDQLRATIREIMNLKYWAPPAC